MKQRILERARRTLDAFMQEQCAETGLTVLAVNPEVDGDGDEFLCVFLGYDDSNGGKGLIDAPARLRLEGRVHTALRSADVDAFPVISYVAESEKAPYIRYFDLVGAV